MIIHIVTGVLMGIVFGMALEKGRVFEPGMIVGQFQFRNFIMLKMFMTAIATTAVCVAIMVLAGWATLGPKAAIYPGAIAGGVIFGIGMALAGACPGTVLAQIGAGYRDAWAVFAGGIVGAMTYGYMEPALSALNSGPGKITLADVTGIPYWALAFGLAVVIVIALVMLEKWRSWKSEFGRDYDGLLTYDKEESP